MAIREQTAPAAQDQQTEKPRPVFFPSETAGPSRRVEGFLAQVLQRRGNHSTFRLLKVSTDERPDLAARFAADPIPALMVVDGSRVTGRLALPRGCEQIETFLAPWLR